MNYKLILVIFAVTVLSKIGVFLRSKLQLLSFRQLIVMVMYRIMIDFLLGKIILVHMFVIIIN